MKKSDEKIRCFFEMSLKDWKNRHGREPLTEEDMWEAINEEIERSDRERRSSS